MVVKLLDGEDSDFNYCQKNESDFSTTVEVKIRAVIFKTR